MKTITINSNGLFLDGKAPKFINLCDYTGYNPDLGTNGGAYGFWDTMHFLSDGSVLKVSGSTSEFNICEEPQILTMAEAVAMVVGFVANMDNFNTYVEVGF